MPVYKKGPEEDPGKYRPVSLTLVPRKAMEKALPETVTSHT